MSSSFLVVSGRMQSVSGVIHVVAERFVDLSPRLAQLKNPEGDVTAAPRATPAKLQRSRDFH
jgi:error-prone DNA polymerase